MYTFVKTVWRLFTFRKKREENAGGTSRFAFLSLLYGPIERSRKKGRPGKNPVASLGKPTRSPGALRGGQARGKGEGGSLAGRRFRPQGDKQGPQRPSPRGRAGTRRGRRGERCGHGHAHSCTNIHPHTLGHAYTRVMTNALSHTGTRAHPHAHVCDHQCPFTHRHTCTPTRSCVW